MKRKSFFWGILLVGLMFCSPPAARAYSGGWLPNSGAEVFALEPVFWKSGPGSLFLYDSTEPVSANSPYLPLLQDGMWLDDPYAPLTRIVFQETLLDTGFSYAATAYNQMTAEVLGTIELGDSPEFGFFFSEGNNHYFEYNLTYGPFLQKLGTYLISLPDPVGMAVLVHGASPVPVPASLLLLGSGLLGLLGLSRRAKR